MERTDYMLNSALKQVQIFKSKAGAAERKLATLRTGLVELKATADSIYCNQQKSTLTVAKDLLDLITAFVEESLAKVEQLQEVPKHELSGVPHA
jgi:hypothetical protein